MGKNKSSANDNDRAANGGGDGTNISAPFTRVLHSSNVVELSISFRCGGGGGIGAVINK